MLLLPGKREAGPSETKKGPVLLFPSESEPWLESENLQKGYIFEPTSHGSLRGARNEGALKLACCACGPALPFYPLKSDGLRHMRHTTNTF